MHSSMTFHPHCTCIHTLLNTSSLHSTLRVFEFRIQHCWSIVHCQSIPCQLRLGSYCKDPAFHIHPISRNLAIRLWSMGPALQMRWSASGNDLSAPQARQEQKCTFYTSRATGTYASQRLYKRFQLDTYQFFVTEMYRYYSHLGVPIRYQLKFLQESIVDERALPRLRSPLPLRWTPSVLRQDGISTIQFHRTAFLRRLEAEVPSWWAVPCSDLCTLCLKLGFSEARVARTSKVAPRNSLGLCEERLCDPSLTWRPRSAGTACLCLVLEDPVPLCSRFDQLCLPVFGLWQHLETCLKANNYLDLQ